MKKPKQKTRNTFIAIVILAVIILGTAWLYVRFQQTTLAVKTDKPAYFTIDEPQVEIVLANPKDADSGEVRFMYDNLILSLLESETENGVSMREVENIIIFELSSEFFDTNNVVLAKLTFESIDRGATTLKFDQENSYLQAGEEKIAINKFNDRSIELGVVPDRGETSKEVEF